MNLSPPATDRLTDVTFKRAEEKQQLMSLNDRLEDYIQRQRDVEGNCARLQEALNDVEDRARAEQEAMRRKHGKEMKDLQKELDSAEYARSQLISENKTLAQQYNEAKRDLANADRNRNDSDTQISNMMKMIEDLEGDMKKKDSEISRLRSALSSSEIQNAKLNKVKDQFEASELNRREMEREMEMLRKDLANCERRLQEDADMYEKEIQDLNQRLKDVETKARADADARYTIAMEERRKLHHEELTELKRQMLAVQEARVAELMAKIDELNKTMSDIAKRHKDELARLQNELREARNNAHEGDKLRSTIEKELLNVKGRIAEYERLLDDARYQSSALASAHDQQAEELRNAYLEKCDEFDSLMDLKINLDLEIAKYRELLDKADPNAMTRKRDRNELSSPESNKKRSRNSDVVIEKLDLEADLVTVRNNGSTDVSLKGWIVTSVTGTQNFKFPQKFVLKSGEHVNVWSGKKNNKKNKPPTDLFWTSRYIWNNDGDAAELHDAEGFVVSEIDLRPPGQAHVAKSPRYEREAARDTTAAAKSDGCALM